MRGLIPTLLAIPVLAGACSKPFTPPDPRSIPEGFFAAVPLCDIARDSGALIFGTITSVGTMAWFVAPNLPASEGAYMTPVKIHVQQAVRGPFTAGQDVPVLFYGPVKNGESFEGESLQDPAGSGQMASGYFFARRQGSSWLLTTEGYFRFDAATGSYVNLGDYETGISGPDLVAQDTEYHTSTCGGRLPDGGYWGVLPDGGIGYSSPSASNQSDAGMATGSDAGKY